MAVTVVMAPWGFATHCVLNLLHIQNNTHRVLFCQKMRVAQKKAAHVLQCADRKPRSILSRQLFRQRLEQSLAIRRPLGTALLRLHNLLPYQPVGTYMGRVDRARRLGARRLPNVPNACQQFGLRGQRGHAPSSPNKSSCAGAAPGLGAAMGRLATFRL